MDSGPTWLTKPLHPLRPLLGSRSQEKDGQEGLKEGLIPLGGPAAPCPPTLRSPWGLGAGGRGEEGCCRVVVWPWVEQQADVGG